MKNISEFWFVFWCSLTPVSPQGDNNLPTHLRSKYIKRQPNWDWCILINITDELQPPNTLIHLLIDIDLPELQALKWANSTLNEITTFSTEAYFFSIMTSALMLFRAVTMNGEQIRQLKRIVFSKSPSYCYWLFSRSPEHLQFSLALNFSYG